MLLIVCLLLCICVCLQNTYCQCDAVQTPLPIRHYQYDANPDINEVDRLLYEQLRHMKIINHESELPSIHASYKIPILAPAMWPTSELCKNYLNDDPFKHASAWPYPLSRQLVKEYNALILSFKQNQKSIAVHKGSFISIMLNRDKERDIDRQCKELLEPMYVHIILTQLLRFVFAGDICHSIVINLLQKFQTYDHLQYAWHTINMFTDTDLTHSFVLPSHFNRSIHVESLARLTDSPHTIFNMTNIQSVGAIDDPFPFIFERCNVRLVKIKVTPTNHF